MGPDVSAITNALATYGGAMIGKKVSEWDLQKDVFIHRKVTEPLGLPKVSAGGQPRPYDPDDHFTDATITDRLLTVHASKWDFQLDFVKLENTYLSAVANKQIDPNGTPLYTFIVEQYVNEYMSKLNDSTVGAGAYNAAGTTAATIADGYLTLIAAAITATTLTAITTGAIAATDAVTKVETFVDGWPAWLRQKGARIYCSYAIFDKYKKHYRTLNGFGLDKSANDKYTLDGVKATLEPRSWMGTSSRLIAVPDVPVSSQDNVLHMGVNDDTAKLFPTMHLNLIKCRLIMSIGFQISDLGAIFVNDQA